MAYISSSDVKAIRVELKRKFPKFKISVRKGAGSSSVDVNVLSGPADFADCFYNDSKYVNINQYYLENYPQSQNMLREMIDIMKCAPHRAGGDSWYDKSDTQVDYFNTAFYLHLNIGQWDKPYTQI
jgi:hypothetical protein